VDLQQMGTRRRVTTVEQLLELDEILGRLAHGLLVEQQQDA
jgi:hypothetical protein